MKRLLKFIYGLTEIALSFVCEHRFNTISEWYRYFYLAMIFVLVFSAIRKLNNAIK